MRPGSGSGWLRRTRRPVAARGRHSRAPASHTRIVPSAPVDTSRRPSPENASAVGVPWSCANRFRSRPVAARRTTASAPAEAARRRRDRADRLRVQLQWLQFLPGVHRHPPDVNRVAPLPIENALELHRQLLAKARAATTSSDQPT